MKNEQKKKYAHTLITHPPIFTPDANIEKKFRHGIAFIDACVCVWVCGCVLQQKSIG